MADEVPNPPPLPPPSEEVREYGTPAGWAAPIGITCIVFGALGALTSLSYIAFGYMSGMMSMMPTEPTTPGGPAMPDMTELYAVWEKWGASMKIFGWVGVLLGVLLFFAGWMLVLRRKLSRPVLIGWSYAKTLYAMGYAYYMGAMMKEQMAAQMAMQVSLMESMGTPGSPAPVMPDMAGVAETMANVMTIAMTLWLLALPIFLLVWFYRQKTRTQMALWEK